MACCALATLFVAGAAHAQETTITALTTSNTIVRFNSGAPGTLVDSVAVTGLQPAENLLGIDYRPRTGQLYGLGSSSRLYTIDLATGVATPIGAGPFTPALSGTAFGFDFNPTVDRIRVVSDGEQNLRLHPDTGVVAVTDLPLNYTGGVPADPNVVAAAYTNNFAGATTTTLFDIDSATDSLVTQVPPNDGVLTTVGSLGAGIDTTSATGFDIAEGTNAAFASLTAPAATTSTLYTINLTTGAASTMGTIGGAEVIVDIALPTTTVPIFGLTSDGALVRFASGTPGTILATVAISGLQPAEQLLGIDFRPRTGQLYGVGSSSRLYTIDTTTGAATAIGAGPFTPALSGTIFGFDFNPTVDRIRLVSNTEQNLRLHPDTGVVAGTDLALNYTGGVPADPNVVGAAYTNNFLGATTTTLFDIDSATDSLVVQAPPNDGVLTAVGALGVDTTELVGFDIAQVTGAAFASLTLPAATTSNLYTVNLATGAASLVGTIGATTTLVDIAIPATPPGLFAVTDTNMLLRLPSGAPGTVLASTAITGLQPAEDILGIDFRPRTGQLYGLGSSSRLYTIDTTTGAATAIGAGAFTPALTGTAFGFDFNPTVDRIRVVSDAEQNLRLHPDTGVVAFTDLALNYTGGVPADPNVVAAAYTNNFAGATTTTLFDIDSATDKVAIQSPPNDGVLTDVSATPLGFDTGSLTGFDIVPGTGAAFASLTAPAATSSSLYTINTTTGAATLVAVIGGGTAIRDIALNPVRASNGVLDPGEQCDDDNTEAGDCCSPTGQFEVGPCEDGSACTTGDTCSAGACVSGPPLTCDPCLVCDNGLGCVAPTGLSCQAAFPGKSTLAIVDKADSSKDTLSYKWVANAAVPLLDYGSPTTTSDYQLCIFDGAQVLRLSSMAPAGGLCAGKPCWSAKKTSFVYKDTKERTPDGLTNVTLKAGTKPKQASIAFKGKGALLQPPAPPLTGPLTVRVQRSDGASCYEATFTTLKTNVAGKLTAKGD